VMEAIETRTIPVTELRAGDVLWNEPGAVPDEDYVPTSLVTGVRRPDPGGTYDCVVIGTAGEMIVDLPANCAVVVVVAAESGGTK
jgi:hypothetical protein